MADRTVAEHLARVLAAAHPLPAQRVPLAAAVGVVAAADLDSLVDLPGFDNSAMDGYAVQAADLAAAAHAAGHGDASSLRLPVVADLAAGDVPTGPIGPGQAARIMTGAMVPDGADTVVKVEDTDAGMPFVTIRPPGLATRAGASIRRRGEDRPAGGPILATGTVLSPRHVGLLAAAGHTDVLVHPRPRVAVVSTGAELVELGRTPGPGQIHDSNSHLLAACVEAAGGHAAYRCSVGDDPAQVRDLLDRLAADVDVIIIQA